MLIIHFYIEKKNFPTSIYILTPFKNISIIYVYTQYITFTNLEGHILNLKCDFFPGSGD